VSLRPAILITAKSDAFHHAIEHLAIIYFDDVMPFQTSASMVSDAIMHISASAAAPDDPEGAVPMVSASNCINWRSGRARFSLR